MSYKGILKAALEIIKCFSQSKNQGQEFKTLATLMEKAGTGGALFRNLYRDFLQESYALLQLDKLKDAHQFFSEVATKWSQVSNLFDQASSTKDIRLIQQASILLKDIATQEKQAMEILVTL